MFNVQQFEHPDFGQIRTLEVEGMPYFVGMDVANALGYRKHQNALATHVDEHDALKQGIMDSLGRMQETVVINESGVYALIFGSRLPKAKEFKYWVTSEVLPSIRKTGGYIATSTDMTDEEIMAKALSIANATIQRRDERIKALESENHELTEERMLMLPKVRAYEQVINTPQSDWLKTTQEVANEIGMSAQKLNAFLVAAKIIYKSSGGEYLVTSEYAKWGLHNIVSYPVSEKRVKTYLKWTERGRLYIRALHDCHWNKRKAWHLIKTGTPEIVGEIGKEGAA